MQRDLVKKREQFQVQIRRQNINKLFGLKRIKPKLIESNNDALLILIDGRAILKSPQPSDQQLMTVLRSICDCLKHYEMRNHQELITDILQSVRFLIDYDNNRRQIIKQAAIELLMIICAIPLYKAQLSDIPYHVFDGFNLQMIRYGLIGLNYMFLEFESLYLQKLKWLFFQVQIFKRMLTIVINFGNKRQCFELIKIPFLNCSLSLCYMAHQWSLNQVKSDHRQLLQFSVEYLEKDIIMEAEKDQSMKVFFQKNYRLPDLSTCLETATLLTYPFGLLKSITSILQQVNCDILLKLTQCLHFQIVNMSVEQTLVKCLVNIFNQTEAYLEDQLKEQVFDFIFSLEYANKEENDCLRQMITLAINHSVNKQQLDEAIFRFMGDPTNNKFPKTCHLLEVMEYLQQKEDFTTQTLLLDLISNYVSYNGSHHYIQECYPVLAKFQEGNKYLVSWNFTIYCNEYDYEVEEVEKLQLEF